MRARNLHNARKKVTLRGAQHAGNDAAFCSSKLEISRRYVHIPSSFLSLSLSLSLKSAIYLIEIPSVFPTRWNESGEEEVRATRRYAFDNTIYGRGRWRINFYGDQVAARRF
jgi:hypothetical protein